MPGTAARKLLVCGPLCTGATLLVLAGHLRNTTAILCCLTAAICMDAVNWSMATLNHLDLAPQYAGLLTGLSQTVYGLGGVVSPTVTGLIVRSGTAEEWRLVFTVAGGVAFLGAAVYLLLGSGRRQPWARAASQGCQPAATSLVQS
ncbi:vesicular glutamate transporter 1-like [Bacillus rossius redtenbacheri]|uniref:vesicular glutamate transporter 1-like n=1 Tax=Bacillus rossius redtenbacheri TaxID=93214 RepID=UPI002FDE71E5